MSVLARITALKAEIEAHLYRYHVEDAPMILGEFVKRMRLFTGASFRF